MLIDSHVNLHHHAFADDREHVRMRFHDALARGDEFWEDEYRFARSDGTYADVLERGRMVRDRDGYPVRVVGAMINVTERRRAQARDRFLVQLDDALRPLVDPDAITHCAATILGQSLQVNRCAYAAVEDDEPEPALPRAAGRSSVTVRSFAGSSAVSTTSCDFGR